MPSAVWREVGLATRGKVGGVCVTSLAWVAIDWTVGTRESLARGLSWATEKLNAGIAGAPFFDSSGRAFLGGSASPFRMAWAADVRGAFR